MADTNYIASIKDLLLELRDITIQSMATTGIKTSSELSKSVKYVVTKDGIQMEVAEYYPYVSEGRKGTNRSPRMHRIPLDALIQWIKQKRIVPRNGKTINQLAWAIQTKIYYYGLRSTRKVEGKKFAEKVATNVADYTAEELANFLATEIADELVDMFAPVAV